MMRLLCVALGVLLLVVLYARRVEALAPANTETLTCVRVKQVTPAGTINYLCEVRK
jgi:hypothetical protein